VQNPESNEEEKEEEEEDFMDLSKL